MKLQDEERETLVALYLEKAGQTYSEFEVAIEAQKWSMAANRMYYSLFHAITALLIKDKHQAGTHLGVKINFSKYYVLTGICSREQGRLFSQLASLRERADYDCFFTATKEDVETYLPEVKSLYRRVEELCAVVQ